MDTEEMTKEEKARAARREYMRAWRAKNPDKVIEYRRNAYEKNKEYLKQYHRNYNKKNRAKIREIKRRYWEKIFNVRGNVK